MAEAQELKSLEDLRRDYERGRDPMAYLPFASALLSDKQFSRALDVCQQGLSRQPSLRGRVLLARICLSMGRYEDAYEALKPGLAEAPDSFSVNFLYVQTQVRRGEWAEAQIALNRLERMRPDDPEVRELARHVREAIAVHSTVTPLETDPLTHPPVSDEEFKSLVAKDLQGKRQVGFCFFQSAGEPAEANRDGLEGIMGVLLNKSERIVEELGMGELTSLMLDFDGGYVLASRAGGEYLVTQFGSDLTPGTIRTMVNKYLSLQP